MTRVAVFVDAGYLYAQGSAALAGSKQQRHSLQINETAAVAELSAVAAARCPTAALLRVYWYDGISLYKGLSSEQGKRPAATVLTCGRPSEWRLPGDSLRQ